MMNGDLQMKDFLQELSYRPVIASVRDLSQMKRAAAGHVPAIFLLGGSILTLEEMVGCAHDAGKRVFVHLDLLGGLGRDAAAVEWCVKAVRPDGVISTRVPLLRRAGELGVLTIQRLFVMDSASLDHGANLLRTYAPDMLEVLPGLVPKAISALRQQTHMPIIAGGMVTQTCEVNEALKAGAVGVSTSAETLWAQGRTA